MRLPLLIVVLASLYAVPVAGIEPGPKCEANKLKTAGVYSLCRLKAEAKALKTGEAPDYSKCDETFGKKWGKIETKADGACPVTGDQLDVQLKVSGNTDSLTASIAAEPACGNGVLDPLEACEPGGTCIAVWCFEGQTRFKGMGTCQSNCGSCGICRSVVSNSFSGCSNCPAGILDCPSAGGLQECLGTGCDSSDDCPAGMTCQFFPASPNAVFAKCCSALGCF